MNALRGRSGSLYEIQLYMAMLYEGFLPQHEFFAAINKAAIDIAMQAERAVETLSGAVRSFRELTGDALPSLPSLVLGEREARLFLRGLVNYDPAHTRLHFIASPAMS